MESRLISAELTETLKNYPLYSQDGKEKDATCVCVFYIGGIRWYVLEGQPEGNDFTIFSVVVGMQETEYGYASLKEMESIEVNIGVPAIPKVKIQRDMDFKPCALEDIPDDKQQTFLSRMYDKE